MHSSPSGSWPVTTAAPFGTGDRRAQPPSVGRVDNVCSLRTRSVHLFTEQSPTPSLRSRPRASKERPDAISVEILVPGVKMKAPHTLFPAS